MEKRTGKLLAIFGGIGFYSSAALCLYNGYQAGSNVSLEELHEYIDFGNEVTDYTQKALDYVTTHDPLDKVEMERAQEKYQSRLESDSFLAAQSSLEQAQHHADNFLWYIHPTCAFGLMMVAGGSVLGRKDETLST